MARWINVTAPFNYHWPDRAAVTHFSGAHLGDHFVKDEIADFAVEKGYATEGKADEQSRSSKGGVKRVKAGKKERPAAKATDTGGGSSVGDANLPDDDRAADRAAVDHDAG